MRKQDQLNALIRSLSKNEKRYFKLQASMHSGDKTFTRLFDELAKSDIYEPEILSKRLKTPKPVLGHVKAYLEKTLISSLRQYEQDNYIDLELTNYIQAAKILFERNQLELALSAAERGIERAREFENFIMLICLLRQKVSILMFLGKISEAKETRLQKHAAIEQLREEEQLWSMMESFADTYEALGNYDHEIEMPGQELFNTLPEKLKSNVARVLWHFLKQFYYYQVKHDLKSAIYHCHAGLDIYNSSQQFISFWPPGYLLLLSNLSSHYGDVGNFERAIYYAKMLYSESDGHRKDIPVNSNRLMHRSALSLQIYMLCCNGDYEECCELGSKFQYEFNEMKLHQQIVSQHHYALALFHMHRYDEALKICQEMQSIAPDVMKVILFCNRLLIVRIHHDLKNYQLLPYLVNSAATWAKRHELQWPGTKEILAVFRKFTKIQTDSERKEFFNELKIKLQKDISLDYVRSLALQKWIDDNLANGSQKPL